MNILIINQFADNKGDRAVLHVLLKMIQGMRPDASITVSTTRPEAWQQTKIPEGKNPVSFVHWSAPRRFPLLPRRVVSVLFRRLLYPSIVNAVLDDRKMPAHAGFLLDGGFVKALKKADIVISTGGHHFTNWFAKDGIAALFLDLALAVLLNKPTYIWSQTLGPLTFSKAQNQRFLIKTLEACRQLYVRDRISHQALKDVGMSSERVVDTLESVFALKTANVGTISQRPMRVGIAIYTGPNRNTMDFTRYVQDLACYAKYAVAKGYEVLFFPMQIKDQSGDDRPRIQEIIKAADAGDSVRILDADLDTDEHVSEVAKCRIFVAHKTHAVVFALCTGTPTIGIAYHPKATDFMALYGQEYRCIAEAELSLDWLKERHEESEQRGDELHSHQMEITRSLRERINEDFRRIIEARPN